MSGAGLGGLRTKRASRIARIRERPLRLAEALLRGPLLALETNDGRVGFRAPHFERGRSSSAERRSTAITSALRARRARLLVGALTLRLVRDDGLFLSVLFRLQSGDRARGLGDRQLELRHFRRQTRQLLPIDGHALAELLDLASGRQNASRLDFRAAGDQMRAAQHVSVERGDRRGRLA